jgi:CubicO group peptidase (beta-lactamase class C family)
MNLHGSKSNARTWLMALAVMMLVAGTLRAAETYPGATWETASPAEAQMSEVSLNRARDYALTSGGSGYITRSGKLVLSWGDPAKLYDLKSSTKSFGSAALGLAIGDGKLRLDDKARKHHPTLGVPTNENNPWLDEITILQLASQTAGFQKPGGYTRLLFRPGTQWDYSDSGPNWLAECITLAYRRDADELMFERVFTPIGIKRSDLRWRKNSYRPELLDGIPRREFGAGIHANVDAMARFGLLHLRDGQWKDKQLLPRDYIVKASRPLATSANLPIHANSMEMGTNAPKHYGLLWWNNADGALAGVPRDAFWSWGLYDSVILVIPSLDVVVARAGMSWKREKDAAHYDVLKPFFEPIAQSCGAASSKSGAAAAANSYPPSAIISGVIWAPTNEILRKARGSDNWPMTWADDEALYTAYGDGNGFEPFTREKLSIGIARVHGTPPMFTAENLHSNIEQKGDGKHGLKASGLLMVDGMLYMWLRNATNAQLSWSQNHGATWKRAEWKFTTSFGCPTFLNFSRNYASARDSYVYVYSQDADDAYSAADQMVLARVPKERIRDRAAYEFFHSRDASGGARWTTNIAERGAVFAKPGRCYRSGISYNAGLKRYLWCQTFQAVSLGLSAASPSTMRPSRGDRGQPHSPRLDGMLAPARHRVFRPSGSTPMEGPRGSSSPATITFPFGRRHSSHADPGST